MRTLSMTFTALLLLAAATPVLAQQAPAAPAPAGAPPAEPAATRRLTAEDAVMLAIENNLGIQVARINPLIEDLSVAQARGAWIPSFTTQLQQSGTDTPNSSILTGAQGSSLTTNRFGSNVGVQQVLPWGGNYSVGWDSARITTTNLFANFSPQLQSSLQLNYTQPLLRGFTIDLTRQQVLVSLKNREIADEQLRQQLVTTTRTVRNSYWDLAYAIASLQVAQQSLDLANQSLRETQARVNIGTTPPIDIVEAQAEVATREEAVIVAEASIETAQDTLRTLIFNPAAADFWTVRIEPTELPNVQTTAINVDTAVSRALEQRTDLQQTRKTLEASDINIRYSRNQTLPDVTASVQYGLTGLGGTQFIRSNTGGNIFGTVTGQIDRSYGAVLSDLFGNRFPSWTAQLNISYPIGRSPQEASLARARLQYSQSQTQLRNQQLQVTTQVRQAGRQVQTNQKRMDTTRASRELTERRLEAEQRKLAAGTSTNFQVFQAQRDLAQARANELRAILDYQQSLVDFDTVQQVPLAGGGAVAAAVNAGAGATSGLTTGAATGSTVGGSSAASTTGTAATR